MEEDLIKRQIRINRYKVVTNIILILVFLVITVYIIYNVETLKMLGSDVCRMCEKMTGGTCMKAIQIGTKG